MRGIMKINQLSKQPEGSIVLRNWHGDIHYLDSYQANILNPNNFSVDVIATKIVAADLPKWEKALISIRESIAGLFKLKTGMLSEPGKNQSYSTRYMPGDKIGFFPVIDRSETEIVAARNDKHLGFRVSVILQNNPEPPQCSITITTIVQFNNIWGRLYFFPVKPFHKAIVKQSLKRFMKEHQ
jgi:hypothetical protein